MGKAAAIGTRARALGRNTKRRVPDVRRRTRQNAYTIRGAAPDVSIGRPTAVRAGARPSKLKLALNLALCYPLLWRVIAGLILVLPEESPNTGRQHAP